MSGGLKRQPLGVFKDTEGNIMAISQAETTAR
jgi:hypothetical protein